MSGWYNDGLQQLLARTIPEEAGVYMVGVNDDYVFNATHTTSADYDAFMLLPELQLQNVTYTNGVLDADDPKWLAAAAGVIDRSLTLQGVIVLFKLGDAGALLAFIDRAHVGLPQTLEGLDVTAKLDPRGILKI